MTKEKDGFTKKRSMTMSDVVSSVLGVIFGFITMYGSQFIGDNKTAQFYSVVGFVIMIVSAVVFIIKYFRRPIEDDLPKESEQ